MWSVSLFILKKREVFEFGFLWNLSGFSSLRDKQELLSPVFVGGPETMHKWYVEYLLVFNNLIVNDMPSYLGNSQSNFKFFAFESAGN